jgi:polygalacturonase
MFMKRSGLFVSGLMCVGMALHAQDTRVVNEPQVPKTCTVLKAELAATPDVNGGKLREQDESKLDSARIQQAIDRCGAGLAVKLASDGAKNAFLTGPLELREGVTLLIDKGVTLYGSSDPAVYEMQTGQAVGAPVLCGTSLPRPKNSPTFTGPPVARPRGGCRALITINAKNAALMGEGSIDGRGYAKLKGRDYSWWEMARKAQPNDDLYFSTRLIVASHADGLVLYQIHLKNSPNFHVSVNQTNGFTAWGVHLQTPVNKALIGTPNDARNTDGIDPGTSQNITIANSWIDNGDDNVAIKQGVSHMSVVHDHFYTGHGMSIGSETVLGQSYLLVDDVTEDHTTSGIRIKSNVTRGGPVHDLTYQNVCMRDVPIPIAISPYYTNQTTEPFEDPKYTGEKIPDYKNITLKNVYSETPGDVLIAGLNDEHRTQIQLESVQIKGMTPKQMHLAFADVGVSGCPRTNLPLGSVPATVKLTGAAGPSCMLAVADPCKDKFLPMQ